MSKITDKMRLDFLQRLMRRRGKQVSFGGRVIECPLDSFLRIHAEESAHVSLCDTCGRADDGLRRAAKSVRKAIDNAICHVERDSK